MSNFGFALKYASEALKNNSSDVEKEVYFLLGGVTALFSKTVA